MKIKMDLDLPLAFGSGGEIGGFGVDLEGSHHFSIFLYILESFTFILC